jgi:hypothetical protein
MKFSFYIIQNFLILSARKTSIIYILIDVLALCSQIAGIGLQATGDLNIIRIGSNIILAGLIFQLMALTFCIFMVARCHKKLKRQQTAVSSNCNVRWEKYLLGIYIAVTALLIRNLVRAV